MDDSYCDIINARATTSHESGRRAASASPVKRKKQKKERTVLLDHHAVYCLISRSDRPAYKGRAYIGYTVDTNRRIMQHNGGTSAGGAKKTSGRGPWDMIFCVEGFPNNTSGLRFEWASQNPGKSRALKQTSLVRRKKESVLDFRVRIACHLMRCPPWNRLGLSFRWLIPERKVSFPDEATLQDHVGVIEGLLPPDKERMVVVSEALSSYERLQKCVCCGVRIERAEEMGRCSSFSCVAHSHLRCLAERGLRHEGTLQSACFPVRVCCVSCNRVDRWSDIVRRHHEALDVLKAHPERESLEGFVPKKLTGL